MKIVHKIMALMKGKNSVLTPKEVIKEQMNEPRPLPMGMKEFDEWSDRIISGALIPGATVESQKVALAGMIMTLGPNESHKPDAHFIHGLRVNAAKIVAVEVRERIKAERESRANAS